MSNSQPLPFKRKPPDPPKYIVKIKTSPDGETQEVIKVLGKPPEVRPPWESAEVPKPAIKTASIPQKVFACPPPQNIPTLPVVASEVKRKTNSKTDVKEVFSQFNHLSATQSNQGTLSVAGGLILKSTLPPPKNVAIPRPFLPPNKSKFASGPLLHNRAASGAIYGSYQPISKISQDMVPYLPALVAITSESDAKENGNHVSAAKGEPYRSEYNNVNEANNAVSGGDEYGIYANNNSYYYDNSHRNENVDNQDSDDFYSTMNSDASAMSNTTGRSTMSLTQMHQIGPDNPTKELSDTWTACWDNEAGAVYYYNHISGEATWIPPEELRT